MAVELRPVWAGAKALAPERARRIAQTDFMVLVYRNDVTTIAR